MQYSITTATSAILFASVLTSAAVINNRQASEVRLTVKVGDGDASRQVSVATGSLQVTDRDGRQISGCNAILNDAGISCQAFSDAQGLTKLGNVFNSQQSGIWSDKCDGGVSSRLQDAVQVGSICCADSRAFPNVCGGGNGSKNDGSNNNTPQNSDALSVRIQLSGLSELAIQDEILANGEPQPVRNAVGIQTAAILRSDETVTCQAFTQREDGTFQPIDSGIFSVDQEANISKRGVDVAAVSCNVA